MHLHVGTQVAMNFVEAAGRPPQRSPDEQQGCDAGFPGLRRFPTPALEINRAEQAAERDECAAQVEAVEQRCRPVTFFDVEEKRCPGRELQRKPEGEAENARLARADPDNGRALERPGRGSDPAVERERDCERTETHAEREKRLGEQAQVFPGAAPER